MRFHSSKHATKMPLTVVTLAAAALLGWSACSTQPVSAGGVKLKEDLSRKLAPDFSLKDADGRTVHLSDYRGKVLVLDFWATWCGPCKVEIPWFTEFERAKKSQGFAVLGVAEDDEGWPVVKPFLKDMNVNYRVLMGDDKTAELYGGLDALPTTFLIDRNGRIAATHVGLTARKEFENAIDELLRDKNPTATHASLVSAPPACCVHSRVTGASAQAVHRPAAAAYN